MHFTQIFTLLKLAIYLLTKKNICNLDNSKSNWLTREGHKKGKTRPKESPALSLKSLTDKPVATLGKPGKGKFGKGKFWGETRCENSVKVEETKSRRRT